MHEITIREIKEATNLRVGRDIREGFEEERERRNDYITHPAPKEGTTQDKQIKTNKQKKSCILYPFIYSCLGLFGQGNQDYEPYGHKAALWDRRSTQ